MAVAFYFMLRPFWQTLFPRDKNKKHEEKTRTKSQGDSVEQFGQVALELVALVSLAIGFPYGAFGLTSIIMLLGLSIGLVLLPHLTRPLIAVAMAILAASKLPAAAMANLVLVVVGFLVLRLGFGVVKRLLGVRG